MIEMSFFGAKKALLEHFIFSGKSVGFPLVLSEATNQSMERRSHWYANNMFCLISKRKPHRRKTKGSRAAPFCHLHSSNEQKHAEWIKQEKNKRDHGYSVCSLHQKEAALDQYKWNAFIPEKSLVSKKGAL